MLGVVSLLVVVALTTGAPSGKNFKDVHYYAQSLAQYDEVWQSFKSDFSKDYDNTAEDLSRKIIFAENLKTIEAHNYLYAKGLKTYMMGVNEHTDMTFDEFLKHKTGLILPPADKLNQGATYLSPVNNFTLPQSVDWREKGFVTEVKNQGDCGSCWAFSSTGSLEGQTFRKTGKLVSLSEQHLIDCSGKYGNMGCGGGWMAAAFEYIKANNGIATEKSYPYEQKDLTCRYKEEYKGATVTGYVEIKKGDEHLTEALATVRPISVAIHVNENLRHYKSGVFNEPNCNREVNHGVLAVGYGTLHGQDYYIVKNSWGPVWGDKGYILMSRNQHSQCHIAEYGIYPLV